MPTRSKKRRIFSVLAGDGRSGLDVPATRVRLRELFLTTTGPIRLSDDDRMFLVAELNAAELEPEALARWFRFRDAAFDAWSKNSVSPLRDPLELPRKPPGRKREPAARGRAMLDAYRSGDSIKAIALRESIGEDHARTLIRAAASSLGIAVEWRERVTRPRDRRRRRAAKSRA